MSRVEYAANETVELSVKKKKIIAINEPCIKKEID